MIAVRSGRACCGQDHGVGVDGPADVDRRDFDRLAGALEEEAPPAAESCSGVKKAGRMVPEEDQAARACRASKVGRRDLASCSSRNWWPSWRLAQPGMPGRWRRPGSRRRRQRPAPAEPARGDSHAEQDAGHRRTSGSGSVKLGRTSPTPTMTRRAGQSQRRRPPARLRPIEDAAGVGRAPGGRQTSVTRHGDQRMAASRIGDVRWCPGMKVRVSPWRSGRNKRIPGHVGPSEDGQARGVPASQISEGRRTAARRARCLQRRPAARIARWARPCRAPIRRV